MIRNMRETLELKYVTENIGSWIDMHFGCDQFNEEKFNQYYPQTYPDWWDKESDMYKNWKKKKEEEAKNNKDEFDEELYEKDDFRMFYAS